MTSGSWREKERGHLVELEVNMMLGTISHDKDRDVKKDNVSKESHWLDHFIYRGEIERWKPQH